MKVATPSIFPGAGTFASPTSVTLTTTTSGAVVRYTLDGSNPTSSSAQYTSPVPVDHTSTLKAAGFKANWSDSNVNTGVYTMNFGTLAAPTVEPATGTYTSAGTVTMSSAETGATIRFTTNGETPTPSSAVYTSPLPLDGSMTVKAKAFHPDYTASAETSRAYTLAAAPPTISPSTGVYTSAQDVTITAASEPPATVRYTVDGSEPTETSTAYTATFSVETATTVKARSFPSNGWAASAAASAALSFDYGTLAAPTASPDGGVYADAQSVTLSGPSGATIRYTSDGNEPTAVSNVYVAPIPTGSGAVTIKARAFHPDWTQSAVISHVYTIDSVAPTISSSRFPAGVGGWHNTPTTISFTCEDNVGISSCSSPLTVSSEGNQQIVGTAIDEAGRQANATVTVNLDLTAPDVAITTPSASFSTSDSSVDIVGEVDDALSGVVAATCNGQSANVVAGAVSCTATLGPGRNDVILAARDAAGNVTSQSVRIVRIGTSSVLGLTPTGQTLLVDETTSLSLTDEFGAVVTAATWSSSDPAIVSVSMDDPPLLTALQAGTVTISAVKNGLGAEALLTVMAGTTLPYGTTRWSISGAPGYSVAKSIVSNRVDLSVPDLFSVEMAGSTMIVRGITASGDVQWVTHAPGEPLMGDSFGGLVAGIGPSWDPLYRDQYTAYARFAGPDGSAAWRYDSVGTISKPAQAPDGTIYAVERYPIGVNNPNGTPITETQLVVLDGANGAIRARYPLARERRSTDFGCSPNSFWDASPATLRPVVGTDGYGYVLVRRWTNVRVGTCSSGTMTTLQDAGVTLLRVSPSGEVSPTSIYSQQCDKGPQNAFTVCDSPPVLKELFPDGIGGTLVRAFYYTSATSQGYSGEMRVARVSNASVQFSNVVDNDERITMIGDIGTAFLAGDDVRAVDVTNWTPKWVSSNTSLEPVVALPNGKAAMHDLVTGQLIEFNETGAPGQSGAFGGRWGNQSAYGLWTGVDDIVGQVVSRVSLALNEASNTFASLGQLGTGQNAPRYKKFNTIEDAALMGLDYIYDLTRIARWEFGGVICGQPGSYWWSSIVTDEQPGRVITIDSPGLTPEQRAHLPQCPPAGNPQPVASFHTHVFNGGEPYPSGLIAGTQPPNDLTTAAARPDLVFFVRTPNRSIDPTGLFSIRYQAIDEEGVWTARNNMFKWNGVDWLPYSPQ